MPASTNLPTNRGKNTQSTGENGSVAGCGVGGGEVCMARLELLDLYSAYTVEEPQLTVERSTSELCSPSGIDTKAGGRAS